MDKRQDSTSSQGRVAQVPQVYVTVPALADDRIDLWDLWQKLLEGKWIVIGITSMFMIASIAYSLLATPIYRSEVLLAPVKNDPLSEAASRIGGIASLAGINLSSGSDNMHALAILQSKDFIGEFIEDENLLPVLFPSLWDAQNNRWRSNDPTKQPDVRDGIRFFDKNVRTVSEESRSGLVTLAIEWTDAELAADWAAKLVVRANQRIRTRDIKELEQKLEYLNGQLESAQLVELRQAISRLIEEQVNAMMMAQARTEYAFKVIDPAVPPKLRAWPKRTLIVITLTFFGGILGVIVALMSSRFRGGSAARHMPSDQ